MARPGRLRRIPVPVAVPLPIALMAAATAGVLRLSGLRRSAPLETVAASAMLEARTIKIGAAVAGVVVACPIEKGHSVRWPRNGAPGRP